jgi:hypothetical protein
MKAIDFILQTRIELNEKTEFWSDEEMLIKLQRSYVSLQYDLPFFIAKESLAIQSGISEYYLKYTPLKNINCTIDGMVIEYRDTESFYSGDKSDCYTFNGDQLLLGFIPLKEQMVEIVYRYEKHLENGNCEIETPSIYNKALRLLFMSEIHEKPTRNTKERNLNIHYLKLYDAELRKLRVDNKMRSRNIKSNYQRI